MNRLDSLHLFFKRDHFKKEMNRFPSSIFPWDMGYVTLPETNGSHLKMGGWKMISLEGRPIFRGKLAVFVGNLRFLSNQASMAASIRLSRRSMPNGQRSSDFQTPSLVWIPSAKKDYLEA